MTQIGCKSCFIVIQSFVHYILKANSDFDISDTNKVVEFLQGKEIYI